MDANRQSAGVSAFLTWSVSLGFVLGLSLISAAAPAAETAHDEAALIKALTQSKHSLADGLRQATKRPEVPISAKFEFDDNGKLSLSVYTAEKGPSVDPEHNVLKELSGNPTESEWKPEVEVFKDVPHTARASQQLTLMSLSRARLVDIVMKAQKAHTGTPFSVAPVVRNGKPLFAVLEADKGKVVELDYSVIDGKLVRTAAPKR